MNNQFRVWDGEEMRRANEPCLCVRMDGLVYEAEIEYSRHSTHPDVAFSERPDWKVLWCTGETDKNDNLIFQGDIVQGGRTLDWPKDKRSVVVWRERGFYVKAESFGWEGEELWDWDDLEVIGNKYQHPHLLNASPD